jgi:branched-chain amino acid transport system ATP-binding protein
MMLEVRGLCAFYGANQALHGIDFSLGEGGIIALLGANGAGKTTTLRALCGIVRCSGEIRFRDNVLPAAPPRTSCVLASRMCRRGVGPSLG